MSKKPDNNIGVISMISPILDPEYPNAGKVGKVNSSITLNDGAVLTGDRTA